SRFRVHLHQSLQRGDAHVVIVVWTATLFAERLGLLGHLLRRVGVATASLRALDACKQCLRVFASRRIGIVAGLLLDRVDGVAQVALAAELIERIGAIVQGVAGVSGARIP